MAGAFHASDDSARRGSSHRAGKAARSDRRRMPRARTISVAMAKPTLRRAGTSLLFKLAVGLGVVTAFGFLFIRSLHDTTTTAYTAERQDLRGWTLVLEPASRPNDPLLAMRPSPELAN